MAENAYNLQWVLLTTRTAPSSGGYGLPSNTFGSAVFAQMTTECPYTLQRFACFPLKTAPSHVGIWTSCNTWFIGPTRAQNAMATYRFSHFCRAHWCDRLTQRQKTLLGIGLIIFGTNVTEKAGNQNVLYFPTSPY